MPGPRSAIVSSGGERMVVQCLPPWSWEEDP